MTSRTVLTSIAALLLLGIVGIVHSTSRSGQERRSTRSTTPPPPVSPPTEPAVSAAPAEYVGRDECIDCHAEAGELWSGSHHDLAMDIADERTVLGDFEGATFTYHDVTSTFSTREGRFFVETDGPDGTLTEYEIDYVFGVWPLQQYLVAFPGGRYQVLPLCWDTRPEPEGGQRWFHIYPDEHVDHLDPLHWTGRYQNWNFMCAECHSTRLERGYDVDRDAYETTWFEIDVSCEACHGPGSRHVDWAAIEDPATPNKGLAVRLEEDDDVSWIFDLEQPTATRSEPRRSHAQIETCARCHARRSPLHGSYVHGRPLLDTHRLSLLIEPLYHADGQILDEVYVYGSFLQSKMFHKGVTCSDCHEPHSLQLRSPGNAMCARCHVPAVFDTPLHHFHPEEGPGSGCVDCHMPERLYMVVDPRHDHSFRVPRPDLTVALGTPNACTPCHRDRSAEWAADAVANWYGPGRRSEPHFGEGMHLARTGGPGAGAALAALAADDTQPGIARATALSMLSRHPGRRGLAAVTSALDDHDPLVRMAAVAALEMVAPAERLRAALPRLADPVRAVRNEAARVLAPFPGDRFSPRQREAIARGVDEYVASQMANADRPESHLNIGVILTQRGRFEEAEASYRRAIRLAPDEGDGYVNLADLYRMLDRDADGEAILREALTRIPDDASVHHALGLVLVRVGRRAEAVEMLLQASRLGPDEPRFAYVAAIGLDSIGEQTAALETLETALARHPHDRDILLALITMHRDAGRSGEAERYAEQLRRLDPDAPTSR